MEPTRTERRDFIHYPTNRVVGTIADAKNAKAAIESLIEAGFAREDIDILHGEEDVRRLDPTGEEHGFLAQFQRTLIRTTKPTEEYRHLMRHVEDVRAGRFVVMVLAEEPEQRVRAADILSDHGAEFIGFYGRWTLKGLPPDIRASERTPDDNGPAAVVKRMFAAFGARDLDGLVDTLHPDSRWIYSGATPRLSRAEFTGRAEVRRFFERILDRLDMAEFNTDQFVVQGDTVVIFGSESGTVRQSGQAFRNEWTQKYVVKNGLIVEMAEYNIQVEPRG